MMRSRCGRISQHSILVALALATALLAPCAIAQQKQAAPPAQTQTPPTNTNQQPPADNKNGDNKNSNSPNLQNGTSDDRLFWTLPNYLTIESEGKVPPLTPGQEFRVVTRESLDISVIPYVAFVAALSQADKNDKSYGQGWGAYGKRVASAFGDSTIENYMTGAIFPSLLREDPRYYQMGKGGFWHRAEYSASRIVVTRTNDGQNTFNYSEIVGAAAAAGVGNIYHANSDRTVSNTLSVWGQQLAWDTFTIEMKEFWPDIRRSISKHKNKEQQP
ncbi:MAG TPA: hypothetical protein VIH76_13535 [Candidatus Acidoferrales bacterium]